MIPAGTAAVPIRRVLAPNPGPFTGEGTNTYVIGREHVAVIDPGPRSEAHVAAILKATAGETITHIFLTHTHRDHSGAIGALAAATGAAVLSGGPYRPARALRPGESGPLDDANDTAHMPDSLLADGDRVTGDGWTIVAIATPGHTANHLAFALPEAGIIFSGDHVMGWSTTIVAPPDGAMGDYMASLDRLAARPETRLLPGHGAPVADAHARIADLKRHRLAREAAIRARIDGGDRTIPAIVENVYRGLDPALAGAAALSVLAHIEDLVARDLVSADGSGIEGRYTPIR